MTTLREVKPPKAVEVGRDGQWYPGFLEAWRSDDERWLAYVGYTVDVGSTYLGWVSSDDVRPLAPDPVDQAATTTLRQ